MKISQNLKNFIEQFNLTEERYHIFIAERQRKIDFYDMIKLVKFDTNRSYKVWQSSSFKLITPDMSNIDVEAAKKEAIELAKKSIEQDKSEINKKMFTAILKEIA